MRSIMARSLRGLHDRNACFGRIPTADCERQRSGGLEPLLAVGIRGPGWACQSQDALEPQNPLQAPPLGHPNGWRRSPR